MRLTITRHSANEGGKMRNMRSINTSVTSNPFCQRKVSKDIICSECYAKAIVHQYNKCKFISWENNTKILSEKLMDMSELPTIRKGAIFRFHSFGELINMTHLRNFFRISNKNPNVTFALWSKRKDIIKKAVDVPENLILIYSTPKINGEPVLPEGYHKVFTVFTAKYAMDNGIHINCSADCLDCRQCYYRVTTETINEVLKSEAHLYHK